MALPAPTVVEPMRTDDQQDGEREEPQLKSGPYLFGYQEAHSAGKEQPRGQPVVVATEAMPERGGADSKGQGDHPVFEKGVVENIDTQDG